MLIKSQETLFKKTVKEGDYTLKFVEKQDELDQVLTLRFNVFNVELGEGFDESFRTGKDEDKFDRICHHLMVIHDPSDTVVGTYRMLTWDMIDDVDGFYSTSEFELSHLSPDIYKSAIELGRACVCKDHRNLRVLYLLWKGIALYMWLNNKRYLFGCASITSQDPEDGKKAMCHIQKQGYMHSGVYVMPKKGFECYKGEVLPDLVDNYTLPKLFKFYITFGAKICSGPVMDRQFKTIDFLMLFDVQDLDERNYHYFFDFLKDGDGQNDI